MNHKRGKKGHRREESGKWRIEGILKKEKSLVKSLESDEPVKRGKKKPGWYCKPRKGPHEFVEMERKQYRWFQQTMMLYVCSACKKQKVKFV